MLTVLLSAACCNKSLWAHCLMNTAKCAKCWICTTMVWVQATWHSPYCQGGLWAVLWFQQKSRMSVLTLPQKVMFVGHIVLFVTCYDFKACLALQGCVRCPVLLYKLFLICFLMYWGLFRYMVVGSSRGRGSMPSAGCYCKIDQLTPICTWLLVYAQNKQHVYCVYPSGKSVGFHTSHRVLSAALHTLKHCLNYLNWNSYTMLKYVWDKVSLV